MTDQKHNGISTL